VRKQAASRAQGTVYDRTSLAVGYSGRRRPDPRVATAIGAALGPARSVLNVGAGAGSYEPARAGCAVLAVEPSLAMLAQRPPGAAPAVRAVAEQLPFADSAFETAMAALTVHHWTDPAGGLQELVRVAPDRQVVLTWDPDVVARAFWFTRDYLPQALERERDSGVWTVDAIAAALAPVRVEVVPVPWDCTDGFFGAYWRRPEAYLLPVVRNAISALALLDQDLVDDAVRRLAADLDTGRWAARYADLSAREELDLGYRLVIGGS
jgi:SAM-dependent methyltransferase